MRLRTIIILAIIIILAFILGLHSNPNYLVHADKPQLLIISPWFNNGTSYTVQTMKGLDFLAVITNTGTVPTEKIRLNIVINYWNDTFRTGNFTQTARYLKDILNNGESKHYGGSYWDSNLSGIKSYTLQALSTVYNSQPVTIIMTPTMIPEFPSAPVILVTSIVLCLIIMWIVEKTSKKHWY